MDTANMGGEDFSYYLKHVPGCYVRFGTAREGIEQYPAHSSKFDFDESALAVGAAYYHAVARIAGARLAKT
jgi:hippurate hydrolase